MTFNLKATRDDLEALKVCLNQAYHQNNAIPKHLQSVVSSLMDTVEDAIRKDDEIQRKVRLK